MLAFVFAINSLLVCAVTSMVQCRAADSGVTYISEFILLCKRGAHTWVLPWLCVAAFAALLLVQLGWMYGVASAWCASRGAGDEKRHSARVFWGLAVAAEVGLVVLVLFDWRDRSAAEIWAHRVGVVLLTAGTFFSLQLIWATLRAGDCTANLRGADTACVPWYSWVECDAAFVLLLSVFMVTTLLNTHRVLSALFEYAAFVLLLVQTTWLFLLCAERAYAMHVDTAEEIEILAHAETKKVGGTSRVLEALLGAYCIEAFVVLLVVL
jgi:hypothetical protein